MLKFGLLIKKYISGLFLSILQISYVEYCKYYTLTHRACKRLLALMNGVKSHRNEQAINVHMATRRKLYRQGQSLKGPPFYPSKGPPLFPKKILWLSEGSFFMRNTWWAF